MYLYMNKTHFNPSTHNLEVYLDISMNLEYGGVSHPPLDLEAVTFWALLPVICQETGKYTSNPCPHLFFSANGIGLGRIRFDGKITRIWPSPESMVNWVQRNWKFFIKGKLTHYFYGWGFYVFFFEDKEDRDLIFRNIPYFFGTKGMYLNWWNSNFNLEHDVLICVHLPHLPLQCWNEDTMHNINDSLGQYIDRYEPRCRVPILTYLVKSIGSCFDHSRCHLPILLPHVDTYFVIFSSKCIFYSKVIILA